MKTYFSSSDSAQQESARLHDMFLRSDPSNVADTLNVVSLDVENSARPSRAKASDVTSLHVKQNTTRQFVRQQDQQHTLTHPE